MTAINHSLIVHWMQLTKHAGVLQPWLLDGGLNELDRRMVESGKDSFCLWMPFGWTPQPAPVEQYIPFLVIGDGRSDNDPRIREIEDGWLGWAGVWRNRGWTVYPYTGCPRWDRRIMGWLDGTIRDGIWVSIYRNVASYRRMPMMLDAMSREAVDEWVTYLRIVANAVGRDLILEGQTEPPDEFGWLLMHRDWRPERTPLAHIAASPHPWKGFLIRGDADLNGADRETRIAEITSSGVHVVTDRVS